jgi:glycosyltransferase involved in cell wall biosynthesis
MYAPPLRGFRRHLAADGITLIHITTPGPIGLAARHLAARLGLPAIGSFHTNLGDYTRLLSGSTRLAQGMDTYMRWLYGACERVLVPSLDTHARLCAKGWAPDRMTVWPRGVDTRVFTPARRSDALREAWRVSDKRPAVLYAGRLSREKGLGMLPALESLLYRDHQPYRLIIAGDGPMHADLRAACPDAAFLGRVPHQDMGTIMASADLLLFPSDTDTAGNVVLEAQACGLPVLVSRAGGPIEQMVDGVSGFACRPGDVADFADRTAALLRSPARRREMGGAARAHGAARTWGAALEPLFRTYRTTSQRLAPAHGRAVESSAEIVAP